MTDCYTAKCKCGSKIKPKQIYGLEFSLFKAAAEVRAYYNTFTEGANNLLKNLQELSWTSAHVEVCNKLSSETLGSLDFEGEVEFWYNIVELEVDEFRKSLRESVDRFFVRIETCMLEVLKVQLGKSQNRRCHETTEGESEGQRWYNPLVSFAAYIKKYAIKGSKYYRKTLQRFEIAKCDTIQEFSGFIQLLLRDKYCGDTDPLLKPLGKVYGSLDLRYLNIYSQMYVISTIKEVQSTLRHKKRTAGVKELKKPSSLSNGYVSSEVIVEPGEIKGRSVKIQLVSSDNSNGEFYKVTTYYSG